MSELKYHYGLKVRVFPNNEQKRIIKLNSDASRFIYNQMVGIDKELYILSKIGIKIALVSDRISQLRKRKTVRQLSNHFIFLNDSEIDSQAKAAAITNYNKAWKQFRKVHKTGTPKFHKKNYTQTYQTNGHYCNKDKVATMFKGNLCFVDQNHVKLPKLGVLKVSGSHKRLLNNGNYIKIGTTTVSKDNLDRYFVSMQLGSDEPFVNTSKKNGQSVGIDLNTENFLTESTGAVVGNPRYYRTIKNRLAREQRKLSRRGRRAKAEHRKLSDCKNYQKQRLLVARIQAKVFSQRKNFLNNLSTSLIKNHDLVVAEELRSSNMLKNHALAMSISDVGWRAFLQMLTYKADMYGKTFLTIDPKYTTQTCSECGHVMNGEEKLTLADRQWGCPNCQKHHIRDHNAAINILNKGLKEVS